MAHGSGLPAASNPFEDFNFSYELAKLVEFDLDPDTINSKLRLPRATLENARKKTKDVVVINAYQFNQWYWRSGGIYTVEDLKTRFNEDVKWKIERLCNSGKKWKVKTTRCGRPPELQIKRNGILMAYCRHCPMEKNCFYQNLTSASIPARSRGMKKDQQTKPESEVGNGFVSQPQTNERVIDGDIVINKKDIGSGAFGSVFKGRLGGQPCAVKILHPHAFQLFTSLETTIQQEALKRFLDECKILENYKHPNVVRHLSSRTDPSFNLPVLVMELMDESLTRLLEKPSASLSLQTEASLSLDIASALQFLHSENIIHRDLCSDNVLLLHTEGTPIAKISDFGMSRILDPDQCRSLTTLGHREAHLPPEARKIASKDYGASLDIFSFGVVVVQIVTKSSKVAREADRDALVKQIEATHPLCSLIHDCIKDEKELRPNAKDICLDLESKVEYLKTLYTDMFCA